MSNFSTSFASCTFTQLGKIFGVCATCVALSAIFIFVAQIAFVKIYVFYLRFIYAKHFCLNLQFLFLKSLLITYNFSNEIVVSKQCFFLQNP